MNKWRIYPYKPNRGVGPRGFFRLLNPSGKVEGGYIFGTIPEAMKYVASKERVQAALKTLRGI